MRTFLRVSLLGNAFIDLACILLLLPQGSRKQPSEAALSRKAAQEQAAVDSGNPIGVFTGETPFVQCELPGSYPAGLLDGSKILAELVPLGGIPRHTTAYEVGWLNWRFEGKPLNSHLGQGTYARPSP